MRIVKKHSDEKSKITGTISLNSKGVGFVSTDLFKEDIEIQTTSLNTAMNKDEVEILIHPAMSRQKRHLGEVLKIIKRAKDSFVGILEKREW